MAKKILTQDTTNYNNVQGLADLVEDQSTLVKQTFDKAGNDQKTFMNDTHITEIQDSTAGTSGSFAVGHGSTNIVADNVGDGLEELYQAIIDVTLGEIPDNSLTNAKLATDIKVGSLATLNTNDKDSVTDAMNEVALATKVYDAVTTVSAIAITTDSAFPYVDGKFINFKADADITAPVTIQIDGGAILTAKDTAGSNISISQNTIYLCQFVDDATDFFELAPRGGGFELGFWGKYDTNPTIPANGYEVEYDADVLPQNDTTAWTKGTAGTFSETINSGVLELTSADSSSSITYLINTSIDTADVVTMSAELVVVSGTDEPLLMRIDDGARRIGISIDTNGNLKKAGGATLATGFDFSTSKELKIVKNAQTDVQFFIDGVLSHTENYTTFDVTGNNRIQFGCGGGSATSDEVHFDYVYYQTDSTVDNNDVTLLGNVPTGYYVYSNEDVFIDDGGSGQTIPSVDTATNETELQSTVSGVLKTTGIVKKQYVGNASKDSKGFSPLT